MCRHLVRGRAISVLSHCRSGINSLTLTYTTPDSSLTITNTNLQSANSINRLMSPVVGNLLCGSKILRLTANSHYFYALCSVCVLHSHYFSSVYSVVILPRCNCVFIFGCLYWQNKLLNTGGAQTVYSGDPTR